MQSNLFIDFISGIQAGKIENAYLLLLSVR